MRYLIFLLVPLLLAACAVTPVEPERVDLPRVESDAGNVLLFRATDAAQTAIAEHKTAAAMARADNATATAFLLTQTPLAATAGAYSADMTATADLRTSVALAYANATASSALATSTRIVNDQATATASARARNDETETAQAQATATARYLETMAPITAIAAVHEKQRIETQMQEEQAASRRWSQFWDVFYVLAGIALVALVLLTAFLMLRWWMMYEQEHRIHHFGDSKERTIVIQSGNMWGGKPEYKVIDAPQVLALPAPAQAVTTDVAPTALVSKRLNLAAQPHGLSLGLGTTVQGDKWLPLAQAGHILIGGPSGSGKTYLVHALIQSVLHRGMADLVLYDGKRGLEFARYQTAPRVRVVETGELERDLADALADMAARYDRMLEQGVREIERYNVSTDNPLPRKVIVLDELKEIGAPALAQVLSLMRMGRAAGVHVILATQFPDAKSVPVDIRGNATTRIAFAVNTHYESMAILGSAGAEKLPAVPGRALVECFGERVEVQTFLVDLPDTPIAVAPPSPFSDVEKKMLEHAVQEGGWFKVKKIARALGMDDSAVTATAEAWQRRGWLSAEKSNVGRPGKNGRELLPPLLELAKRHGIAISAKAPHVAHVAHVVKSPMSPAA